MFGAQFRSLGAIPQMMTFFDHDYIGYAAITKQTFWDDLQPDMQRHHRSIKDATKYANNITIETIHKAGQMQIYTLSP